MDIWIRTTKQNLEATAEALDEFGNAPKAESLPFLNERNKILRMGMPPFRLEVSTAIDGVEFDECCANRVIFHIDEIPVNLISFNDLLVNKKASGRLKDLADVEELERRNQPQ